MKKTLAIVILLFSVLLIAIDYAPLKALIFPKNLPERTLFLFTDPLNIKNSTKNIEKVLVKVIDSAVKTIDVAIYSLNRKNILNAFLRAHQRGVNIRVITETDAYNNPRYRPTYQTMQKAGITVKLDCNIDKYRRLMHNKFIIIDKQRVWTGSCNLTDSDINVNANDVILINSEELAKAYTIEFEEMFVENRWGNRKYDNNEEYFTVADKKIELYISPSDEVEERVIRAINSATSSIHLAMFYLTNDFIYKALSKAIKRGVVVKAVFDERGASDNYSKALNLVRSKNGVIDALSGLIHHKFAIIDKDGHDPIVITGSANWSNAGMNHNDENTLFIHDKIAASLYFKQWLKIYHDATIIYPQSANSKPPEATRVTHHHYNCQPGHTRIEWNTSQIAATSYNLYKSKKPGGPYKLLANVSKKEAQDSPDYQKRGRKNGIGGSCYAHYNDFDVTQGVTYYYVITTLVGDTESSFSNEYLEKVE
ncbi:MAG: phospholipase D-like domain-containing protein [bacterium]|nr:phospholipase D-like domain-containing protein [bacterium]